MKIARLTGCKNFVGKRKKFIFNAFVDLKPESGSLFQRRSENGSDMCGFRSLDNSASKRNIDLLKPVKLTVWEVVIQRITVVKFRMNSAGRNGSGCFEVKIRADTAKFTDMIVARFRKCRDLLREGIRQK